MIQTIAIYSAYGANQFRVCVAVTKEDRENGLMGVRLLPDGTGMIFPQDNIGPIRVWMKGTIIPLDIIFIDQHGVITHVDHEAAPLSERMIWSNSEVVCFLEVAGGTCRRFQIGIGDKIISPIITSRLETI